MNKTLMAIIGAIIILGGASFAVISTKDNEDSKDNETSQTDASMEKIEGEEPTENENNAAMVKNTENYITLADYNSTKDSYSDNTKVLFFHASWCTICQGIEKEINADPARIPDGTTFIKTDFDSETELRQKYGITTQYTFVQVDNDGNQIAKWSATNLDKAVAGIQS